MAGSHAQKMPGRPGETEVDALARPRRWRGHALG